MTVDIPIRGQGGHKEKDVLDGFVRLLISRTIEILLKKNDA